MLIYIIFTEGMHNDSLIYNGPKARKRVVNAFETWCRIIMVKIKWTDRITKDEVFQRAKEERLLFKILKNRRHSWIGHIIRHNEFVVNVLEEQYPGKRLWEDLD
jgi:hypothetical protein